MLAIWEKVLLMGGEGWWVEAVGEFVFAMIVTFFSMIHSSLCLLWKKPQVDQVIKSLNN